MIESICSITVTYNPPLHDNRLAKQITYLSHYTKNIFIVDNASDNVKDLRKVIKSVSSIAEIIELKDNKGIASGFNVGIEKCLSNTLCEYILTLDQDTVFLEDSFKQLELEMERLKSIPLLGVFGFNYGTVRFSKPVIRNRKMVPELVPFVISSGSIIRREVCSKVKFDDHLFMYFVDADFCHKVGKTGYRIAILGRSMMDHEEGERKKIGENNYFFIKPYKFYYIARNSFIMLKRHNDFFGILYLLLAVGMNIMAKISIKETLHYTFRGIMDGVSGRLETMSFCAEGI